MSGGHGLGAALADALADAGTGSQGRVLVAFSGGLDSTVLLHAAAAAGAGPAALHVNHGLLPQADAWERHCERTAASFGVPFLARRVVVRRRGSLEAAARTARYQAFTAELEPGAQLWLAHHREDQAETVLLRLLQGRGLYGMPQRRPLGAGTLVRPLLGVSRRALERYAQAHHLGWIDDPSNADLTLDRNFLRHRVLPELRSRWPEVDGTLLAALEKSRLTDELLTTRLGTRGADEPLALRALKAIDLAGQVELLRLWLTAAGVPAPRRAALAAFLGQLDAAGDRAPELRLPGARLIRYRGRIHLVGPPPELHRSYPIPAGGSLRLPHGLLRLVPDAQGFQVRGALEVRFRQGGESLQSRGRRRSVKQILQEAAVPPWLRPVYPLLFDADGLAAVPGLAQRDAAGSGAERLRAEWQPGREGPAGV